MLNTFPSKFILFLLVSCVEFLLPLSKNCMANNKQYDNKKLEIAIIDFIYTLDGGYNQNNEGGKKLEKNIFAYTIERELDLYGLLSDDCRLNLKRVTKGNLDRFGYSKIQSHLQEPDYFSYEYDLAIWGQVSPLNWPNDYKLDIIVFVNPSKYEECRIYYNFVVKDGSIIKWNHSCPNV